MRSSFGGWGYQNPLIQIVVQHPEVLPSRVRQRLRRLKKCGPCGVSCYCGQGQLRLNTIWSMERQALVLLTFVVIARAIICVSYYGEGIFKQHMSSSLNSLKGLIWGIYLGDYYRVYGDTRSLEYGLYMFLS